LSQNKPETSATMADDIWTEIKDGIAHLRFNRPESRNALTMEGVEEIIDFLRRIDSMKGIRCLSITAAGDHFMAGGDFKNFTDGLAQPKDKIAADFEQRAIDASPIWVTFERLQIPVVCSVRGYAVGGALSFVAGSDITIASENVCFILGHIAMALPPDAGTSFYLPRAVGIKRAKQIAFFGDRIDAQEALSIGLVNFVVPDSDLEKKTDEIVTRLANAPSVAIAEGRQLMNQSLQSNISEQLTAEAEALARCAVTDDISEGVNAVIEKRKPKFTGQ